MRITITSPTRPDQASKPHRVALAVDVNRVRVNDAAAALEELDVFDLIDGLWWWFVMSVRVCVCQLLLHATTPPP
jgi:hypothetical protein